MPVDAEHLDSYTIDIPYGNISMCNMYDPKDDGYRIDDYVGKINDKDIVINHVYNKNTKVLEYYLMIDGYCIPKIFNSFNDAFMHEEIWD